MARPRKPDVCVLGGGMWGVVLAQRTATRVAQSAEQVIDNARGYFDQLIRILDRLGEKLHEACSLGILDGDEIVYISAEAATVLDGSAAGSTDGG